MDVLGVPAALDTSIEYTINYLICHLLLLLAIRKIRLMTLAPWLGFMAVY